MWRSCLARVLIWFVALAGLGLYVEAQTNTGNVYGTVADEQGAGIPGGTVTLMGPQAPRTTTVDEGGRFRFLKIAPEKYSVRVTMPGFTTVTRENVIVVLGKDTQVDVTLKLSAVQEKVTVTDTTPLIDTRKVAPGATFSREELSEIPTTRDIYALIQQVPGVQIDTVNVGGNQSAVAGGPDFIAKGASNVAYLGMVPRSPTTPTETLSRARTGARTRSSTSTPSRTSRSRRADRSWSSRTPASRSTS